MAALKRHAAGPDETGQCPVTARRWQQDPRRYLDADPGIAVARTLEGGSLADHEATGLVEAAEQASGTFQISH